MKVAELEGSQLDYWVARANGWRVNTDFPNGGWRYLNDEPSEMFPCEWHNEFKPSTNWAQGGPIIERERIIVVHYPDGFTCRVQTSRFEYTDHSLLVAAMRAYVASKFGDEVPDS